MIQLATFQAVADAAQAVIYEAKAAGVYRFAGGINEGVAPVEVAADGAMSTGTHPQTQYLEGGYAILESPSHETGVA